MNSAGEGSVSWALTFQSDKWIFTVYRNIALFRIIIKIDR